MKLLYYSDIFGGHTTTFIYNDVVELAKEHTLKYVCIERRNPDKFPFDDVQVLSVSENIFLRKMKWWLWQSDRYLSLKNSTFSQRLNRIIDDFRPDIIHCQFGYEAIRLLDNLDRRFMSIPVLISFHGYDASQLLSKKSYVRKLNTCFKSQKVFCTYCSEFIKDNLRKSGVVLSQNNIFLLYYGTKINSFYRKSNQKDTTTVFLQISSFNSKKGHEYTLRAFATYLKKHKPTDPKLIFCGDGELKKVIEKLVSQLQLDDFVDFTGWINQEQAAEYMESADVFVHHSITAPNGDTEGMPNAIIEAMAMELPVLSTWHSGIPELVEDGINGYLVHEKDVDAYAERMKDVSDWEYLKQNREKIEKSFSLDVHRRSLNAIYVQIRSMT